MRIQFPGFGFALASSVTLLGTGCGAAAQVKMGAPTAAMAEAAPAPPAPEAAAMPPQASGAPGIANDAAPAAPAAAAGVAVQPTRDMLDIEAQVSVTVTKVRPALVQLHELAARLGGAVTEERVDNASGYGSAQLTMRVPSSATEGVFRELEKVGTVTDQSLTARDIGKQYFDGNLRLSSLEATLRRYEEILKMATKLEEVLRLEQELGRIRAEIEQVKGNQRWLADRAARATLHVKLRERQPEMAREPAPEPLPEAKFYPGLRFTTLVDFGKHATEGYVGGGLSLRSSRAFSLDLDLLKRPGSETRGPDAIAASIGGELYSELLGGGKRRFLNPYLGWRLGYVWFDDDNQVLVGATLGLELYKNRWIAFDAEARNYLIFVGDRGAHYGLSPALTARVAF
jgi:hypothetical protein